MRALNSFFSWIHTPSLISEATGWRPCRRRVQGHSQPILAICGHENLVAQVLKDSLERREYLGLVFHDQNYAHTSCTSNTGELPLNTDRFPEIGAQRISNKVRSFATSEAPPPL